MGEEEEVVVINIDINNELEQRIVDQFALFDELDIKKIEPEKVEIFLRSLGMFVTNADIEDIKQHCISPNVPNAFHIGILLPYISECFRKHKYMPKSIEQLFDAFHLLDPDKKGTLEVPYIVEVLQNNGDPFNEVEMKEFLCRAVDHRIHKINYEYLINALCIKFKEEDDLFKLSAAIEDAKLKSEEQS